MVFSLFNIPRAPNTGTCIQQGDLFYSAGLHRNENIGGSFGKNAAEWTGMVEISEEEIPGSKRSMYGYILTDLLQALKGDHLSSVFPLDGALISASAAPHCRVCGIAVHVYFLVRKPVSP